MKPLITILERKQIAPKFSEHDLINLNEHLRSLTSHEALYHLQQRYGKIIQPIDYYTAGDPFGDEGGPDCKLPFVLEVPIGFVTGRLKRQEFIDYLDKLMWYITEDFGVKNKKWEIGIEPVEADNVTEWVHLHKYVYHITSTSRTKIKDFCPDTITGIGLRPRNSDYRYFPKRVHFICPDNNDQFHDEIKLLRKQLEIPNHELRIFRIELNKLNKNVQFYHDPMYPEKNYIYSFVKFPWDVMTEIKL